jgi:uncharacterized Zn-binding protein involved in type VI secretion
MKTIILSLALFSITSVFSQVGIGTTTVESSVILQLDATDKALLLPRVTNTAAIITPVNGMLIFDVSQNCIRGYQNGSWTACYASGTRAPVVVADTATVLEDATTTSINVIANDTDADGDNLTLVAVSTSGGGSVAINADNVSVNYTPLANYNGTETITYSVSDGTFINTTGTLTVTITLVNDEPIAFADTATVLEDATTTSINVIANDTDVDGDNLTLVAVSSSNGGSVAINADNVSVNYTPLANYNGTETITYSVSDGTFINTTGTLTVTITSVVDEPIAFADTATVLEDATTTSINVIANDTHGDGDNLTLVAVSTSGGGSVAINADNVSVDYTPLANYNGTETITYSVSDGTFVNTTGTLTVTIAGDDIRSSYGGGIIAYIFVSGDPGYITGEVHGLIAATSDQSNGIRWFNGFDLNTGATGTALGTGMANTNTIIAVQGPTSTTYAAGLARAYNGGGYSDWYLPSKDELQKLYLNRLIIGGFSSVKYWSSSDHSLYHAWRRDFNTDDSVSFYQESKSMTTLRVRAVRSF